MFCTTYIENDGIWGLKSDKISGYSRSYYGAQYVGFDAPQRDNHEIMNVLTDKAIDWLKGQDKDTPFMLHFNSVAVHHPITPSHQMPLARVVTPAYDAPKHVSRAIEKSAEVPSGMGIDKIIAEIWAEYPPIEIKR
ncbi:MAG: hypothetical protein SNF93_08405 [Rikenellaceae bacterium]